MRITNSSKGRNIEIDASDIKQFFGEVRKVAFILRVKANNLKAKAKKLICRLCQE